jgi:branched-chain amino acid transport system ATP-binding protein
MSDRLFEIRNLTMQFGGVTALSDVNLHVSEGEIAALIGPNGAGKTTVFNVSTGYYSPTSGDVLLNNESIVGLKSNKIARKGLARTFQNIRLFGQLSALDNIIIGRHLHIRNNMIMGILGLPIAAMEEEKSRRKALELLELIGLSERAEEKAKNLQTPIHTDYYRKQKFYCFRYIFIVPNTDQRLFKN